MFLVSHGNRRGDPARFPVAGGDDLLPFSHLPAAFAAELLPWAFLVVAGSDDNVARAVGVVAALDEHVLAADDSTAALVARRFAHLVPVRDPDALAAAFDDGFNPDLVDDRAIHRRDPHAIADGAVHGLDPHAFLDTHGRRGDALPRRAGADVDVDARAAAAAVRVAAPVVARVSRAAVVTVIAVARETD